MIIARQFIGGKLIFQWVDGSPERMAENTDIFLPLLNDFAKFPKYEYKFSRKCESP